MIMRNAIRYSFLILSMLLLGAYAIWTQHRPESIFLTDLRSEVGLNLGIPGDAGNLLGIQPELFAHDYRSPAQLRRKLAAYMDKARAEGLLNSKTVVVLPEHIGTWLVGATTWVRSCCIHRA